MANVSPTANFEDGTSVRKEDVRELKSEAYPLPPVRQDAFGDESNAQVKYKVLSWWQAGFLMVAETISLGILSLPKAMAGLGIVPALIILLGLGIIATYTGYVIGQFKLRYPHITGMADAGEILWGPIGREIVGFAQLLLLVFIMASHILTFTVALNTITGHGTCSIVFGIVGMIASCILSLPRTLTNMTWLSIISFGSIFIAVMISMVALGIQNQPGIVQVTASTTLVNGFVSASNIVFSYASHNSFFTFMAELKNPKDFPKALALLQTIDISLYIITSVVIYRYVGEDVKSPALSSAGATVSKICYGVALPTILIAGVLNGHIAGKAIYLRVFTGTKHLHTRSWVGIGSWIGVSVGLWILAWIIASTIPVFSNLLSLMSAMFFSWFTFSLPGMFWLKMNKGLYFSSKRKIFLTILNSLIIAMGLVLCGMGLYTSGVAIHNDPGTGTFSCANNA
ncbi:transmembrane amino acid transporter protein-domain-containing protein [Mariannaea sp. PMI_226]|nr:transmembrane amino acid transporter protein-domain-containing protein [Mariannaea sp. PMI_226]